MNQKFVRACKNNDLKGVSDCLSRGVDVNTVSEDGRWSGLTIAAEKNYPELLEILLSHPDIKLNDYSIRGNLGLMRLVEWTGTRVREENRLLCTWH